MRKRSLAFVALSTVLSFVRSAQAETYHLIDWNGPGVMYLDGDSVRPIGDHVAVWISLFFYEDGESGRAYLMVRDEVDCHQDRVRHLVGQGYNQAGAAISETFVNTPQPWMDVIPDSNQALEERLACNPAALTADKGINSTPPELLKAARELRSKLH